MSKEEAGLKKQIARLMELLDQKDQRFNEMEKELDEANRLLETFPEGVHRYRFYKDGEGNDPSLPVPRLELTWEKRGDEPDWRMYTVMICLVFKNLCNQTVHWPIDHSAISSSSPNEPWGNAGGPLVTPHCTRRAVFFAAHFRMPLYMIVPDGRAPFIFHGYDQAAKDGEKSRTSP
jgi:hypothetical protein